MLPRFFSILMLLGGTVFLRGQDKLVASPGKPEIIAGGGIQVVVKLGKTAIKWSDYDAPKLSDPPAGVKPLRVDTPEDGTLVIQSPPSIPAGNSFVNFTVTITKKGDAATHLEVPVTVVAQSTLDWEARAIVGWHQAGASSADSTQNLFFDFFVERPFSAGPVFDSRFNLWGQVRIASSPQQKSVPVSQFAAEFASQLGSVPVNELAQSGEFLAGPEVRLHKWSNGDRVRTFSFVAFFGANGAFSDPTTTPRVFRAIPQTSPQFPNFVANFPEFKDPVFRSNAKYVGLVPPDRERFFRQYGGGVRYASYVQQTKYAPPAMFTATIGQDQMITHGRYVGPVFKVDAFYPLPFDIAGVDWHFIYLFGTANLAIAKPFNGTPLAMQLVSAPCPAPLPAGTVSGQDCDVKVYQDNVAVYAIPSSRDTYRIGVGIDFVALLKRWAGH